MAPKRILVTGASGCIGHYITEALIQKTNHELYLLVRNPEKLQINCETRAGVTVIQADMLHIDQHADLLKTIDCAVLAATAWGGSQAVFDVNVAKTLRLMNLLDPDVCEQIIYFSTASVLDRNNELLKEAKELGTDYIRSKYECLRQLSRLPINKRITALFPTLVLGGDSNKPYSHLSAGLPDVVKWINLIRFFKADGSFHFIHGQDIAQVVLHLIHHPPQPDEPRNLVLGNERVTVNQAIEDACAYLNTKIPFRVTLYPWLADLLIAIFRIQMAAWDRFCVNYRHFTYLNPVSPDTFGLPTYCRTFTDVLKISRVGERPRMVNEETFNTEQSAEERESKRA
ncbi:MAG: NAD(P)-dependent oxidoreductase [Microcoleus vaginatus WJT46-NPBG5]|jgi:nucleoside-diphosphate-sugar epimerase|nr:NAD(P)-dependent oxidoreductase [Microcoleus vaginatus WJT46-NPBG5]